jgi:hypothetical protein
VRPDIKAALILSATFILGGALGALGAGAFARREARDDRGFPPPGEGPEGRSGRGGPPSGRRGGGPGPGGFVEHMETLLAPLDSNQKARLRPYLDDTDRRNHEIVDGARTSMRVAMDSLRVKIAPMLDAAQLEKFDEFVRRPPPLGGGPPGLESDGRREPPPSRGRPPP